MAITKKQRFGIFERDNFTCQYCGRKPPDIVLEADHMISIKDGGKDDDINMITSCFDCNRGKSGKSVYIQKKKNKSFKKELKLLKERKYQLEAYYDFIKQKSSIERKELDVFQKCWGQCSNDKDHLTESGIKNIKKLLKTYTSDQVFEAIKIAWDTYYVNDEEKFIYMCGILKNMKLEENAQL